VRSAAVYFHDEVLVRPVEVDLETVQ